MRPEHWKPKKLDALGFVGRGRSRHRPRHDERLYGGAYPFFQTGDIKAAEFYLTEFNQTYNEMGLAQSKLWPPGTLCITIAANIAESSILGVEACFPDSVVGFIPDPNEADVKFIKYYMDTLKLSMQNVSRGTTQDNLSLDKLLQFDFFVPNVNEQRRIAGILSAYDELIASNQRRIKILEEMARALYREWFVQYNAPGVVMGEDGLPEGWEVNGLFDLARVSYGKNLPTKNLVEDGPYPVYGAAKIIGWFTEFTRESRTIICGCRGSVGEMQITMPRCFVTNNSFTFDPTHPDNFYWLYHSLKERGLRDVVGGAAQPQITLEGISSVELVTPPIEMRTRYQRLIVPLFEEVWILEEQTANLRRTRDLLLPRLMSGRVELSPIQEHVKAE